MSRTYHKSKGPGFEYWASRLHPGGEDPGRWTKTQTHRKERRDAKEQIKAEVLADTDSHMADLAEANAFLDEFYRDEDDWYLWEMGMPVEVGDIL